MGSVTHAIKDHVATVVLANEGRFNAMSLAMWQELAGVLAQIQTDDSVRVLLLRGLGERAFVSGADISEFETQRNSEASVAIYNRSVEQAQEALFRCRVPVIAAISGICFGGGLGLALSCDLRYASTSARFRMPAARLGLGYGFQGMKSFLNQLGPMSAAEAFYTARIYNASEGERLGIVQSVHEDVFAHCQALAAQIAENAPLTVRAAKQTMISLLDGGEPDRAALDAAVDACFKSQDYAEGRRAFAEKRVPAFQGR